MSAVLICWKCGASLKEVRFPLSRRAECPACHAELHVCRMCVHYNPRVSDHCDEPLAEHPRETGRANFCDYFKPRPDAYVSPDTAKARSARDELNALFGNHEPQERSSVADKLGALFGSRDDR